MFQANEWFEKGYSYKINNQRDKAIEAYTSAIALNPKFVEAYLERSFMYWSDSKMDKAFQDVKDAISINPNYIDAYYRLEHYYSEMALTSEINGEKDKSIFYQNKVIEVCNKVIELQPKDTVAYLYRGSAYKEIGEYDKALRDFNQIIIGKFYPYPINAYIERGGVYYEKGQYTKAIDDYTQAINAYENYIKPNNVVVLFDFSIPFVERGLAYRMLGNIKMAISDFQRACDMGNEIGCKALKALQKR